METGDVWQVAGKQQVDFTAAAALLAIRAHRQSLTSTTQPELEQSDDSEDDNAQDDGATTKPTAQLNKVNRETMMNKFLDRFGEVLARVKSSHLQSKQQDSKHVAAAAWIHGNQKRPMMIVWAKNEGPDPRDCSMASRLQTWFRAIASTGRVPSIDTDAIWIGNKKGEGLLEYSRNRLEYHISQVCLFSSKLEAVVAHAGVDGPVIFNLQLLCRNYQPDSPVRQLNDVVNVAYRVRAILHKHSSILKCAKALTAVNMLGRLRAAYECFTSTALAFPEFQSVDLRPLRLTQYSVGINKKSLRKRVDELSKGMFKTNAAPRYTGLSRLHIHAEMQVLTALVTNPEWHQSKHRYIGTSRRPCFLCNEFIRSLVELSASDHRTPMFACRESHGKIYPRWTLPPMQPLLPRANLEVMAALASVNSTVRVQLERDGPGLRSAIAESSASVTEYCASTNITKLNRRHVVNQRQLKKSSKSGQNKQTRTLGPKVKTVQVCLFPAEGTKPKVVPIDFYKPPEIGDSKGPESGHQLVPELHAYWDVYQSDRRYRRITVENQEIEALEGHYTLYWNMTDEMPENMYIKNLLGIKDIDFSRYFWHGDVFLVRFSEHPETFAYDVHDAPVEALQWCGLELILQDMWQNKWMERQQEKERHFQESQQKTEADKEVLLQRMYVNQIPE